MHSLLFFSAEEVLAVPVSAGAAGFPSQTVLGALQLGRAGFSDTVLHSDQLVGELPSLPLRLLSAV